MNTRNLKYVVMLIVATLVATTVLAVPVTIDTVKVDGDEIDASATNSIRVLDRSNEISVKVELTATADVSDAQVEVLLRGYDHDDIIEDISDVFDMTTGRTYVKKFNLKLPYRLDKDQYKLRVRVDDRDGDTTQATYEIDIEAQRHELRIKDVIFSPSNGVMSGRALLATVRLANVGMVDEDDGIKVVVSIPALGISAADYMDEINEDDKKTSEELYLRVPKCTEAGVYDVDITVEYDDGDEVERTTEKLVVYTDEACMISQTQQTTQEAKTIITIGPTSQDVLQGEGGVIYPLTLSNTGATAKTYVVSVDGYQDWASIRVSPANIVVLQGGESKAVYVYVSATEDATIGEHMFSVDVTTGAKSLKQFTLKANVVAPGKAVSGDGMNVKNVLLIGLLVLVVLLVILGLIIGFGKLKGTDDDLDDDEEAGQTYY